MSQRALLDANVLHPIVLCDLLIRLARKGLYQALWSPTILEETSRSVLRRRADLSPEVLGQRLAAMKRALPEAMVEGYEELIPGFRALGSDAHVAAAAVVAGAGVIVTMNVRDFPAAVLEPHGIEAQLPDEFLSQLWRLDARAVTSALTEQALATRRPQLSVDDILNGLTPFAPAFTRAAGSRQPR